MKISVLLSNYNYQDFVGEALDSVLSQTCLPDEIIVVDDGSSDESRQCLESTYGKHPLVRLVYQENAGHLSCFNTWAQHATGDVWFFLDSDDRFAPTKIERMLSVFQQNPGIDFVYSAYRTFGNISSAIVGPKKDRVLGSTLLGTYFGKHFFGAPTSGNVIRRSLADRLFPFPQGWYEACKTRGDLGLVMGASLLNLPKYYLAEPLFDYRVHGKNVNYQRRGHQYHYQGDVIINQITEHYWRQMGLSEALLSKVLSEFKTIELPTTEEFKWYRRLIMMSPQPLLKRCQQVLSAWKYAFNSRTN